MSHIHGLPPLPKCFDGLVCTQRTISETSQGELHERESHVLVGNGLDHVDEEAFKHEQQLNEDMSQEAASETPQNDETPFSRLNLAYEKLKYEMAGLRKLDVSLLYQLWTLHEAIQEFKTLMQDRYSDVGSEYSYGLSSRTSSMTSIDSVDLFDDYRLQSDLSGPSLYSLTGSTTSLIQQIEDLKNKTEADFN